MDCDVVRRLLRLSGSTHLADGGRLIIEFGFGQDAGAGVAARQAGWEIVRMMPRPAGHPARGRSQEVGVENCLFCRIVSGEIPATIVFQDDAVVAFKDITPQAPMHVLVIPRRHVASLNELTGAEDEIVGRLVRTAAAIAKDQGYDAGVIARCSTATPTPARPCSTSTCTCSQDVRMRGRRG